jgi:hypothetical protein
MGRKKEDPDDFNKTFERQQRSLNRKRTLQSLIGIAILVAIYFALQLTPYRDLPRDAFTSAVKFVTGFFGSGPKEPDPKYW